jgi:hypothetical protein
LVRTAQKIFLVGIAFILFFGPFLLEDITLIIFPLAAGVLITVILSSAIKDYLVSIAIGVLGILIMLISGQPLLNIMRGTGSMINFIGVLIVMQLFSIPLSLGSYKNDLEALVFKYLRKEKHLYLFTTICSQFFGTFLSLGAIPIIESLLGQSIRNNVNNYARFLSTATSRGYALMVGWAPGSATVLLMISITNLEWSQVFMPGFLLSIVGVITSIILERKLCLGRDEIDLANEEIKYKTVNSKVQERAGWKSMYDIFLVVISMMSIIVFLEKIKLFSTYYCIMLAGIIIFCLWMLKFLKSPNLENSFKIYWQDGLAKTVDLTVLFIGIGILTEAIKNSNLQHLLSNMLPIDQLGYLSILIVPIIIILLSLTGLHPLVSVMVVGNVLLALSVAPVTIIVATLLLGAVVSYCVSPFAGIVVTSAKFVHCQPRDLAWKWNGLFGLIMLVEGITLIYIIMVI